MAQTMRKDGKDHLQFSGVYALCSITMLEKANSLLHLRDLFSLTVNHAHAIPPTTQVFISWIHWGWAPLLMSNYFTLARFVKEIIAQFWASRKHMVH